MVKFPCGKCQKAVWKRHTAICFDLCDKWIHNASKNLDKKTFRNLQSSEISWFCMPCLKKNFHSILSPVNIFKRSLEMHQLFLYPWLIIKVLLKMLTKHAPLKYMSRKQQKILPNLGLQKICLNQLKSKTHCTINFAVPKIINQNLIFITNSKNTAILSSFKKKQKLLL